MQTQSCSAVLACKQLRGSHIFDVLASAPNGIHSEFEMWGKIVQTTTDNGSNFIKAFQVFGEDENNNAVGNDVVPGDASKPGEDMKDKEGGEEVEFFDVSALLNEDDCLEFQLPQHQRCACHLLKLIAIVDAMKATSKGAYKKVYRSTFGKCNAFWNKCGRSIVECLLRPVAAPKCFQVELFVPGSEKTAENNERKAGGDHQSHLHQLKGSNVSKNSVCFILF